MHDNRSFCYSHPDEPVRHSYPLAIRDAGLGTALGLVAKTMPYALMRLFVLVSVSAATLVWWVVTLGGTVVLTDKLHPLVGVAWLFAGLTGYAYVWRTFVRYTLYLLKAGHIAVLTELVTHGAVGNGAASMFEYGKRTVTERFGQVNAMFAVDMLVHGVVRAFNRTLDWLSGLLPIPGLHDLTAVVNAVVYAATTFIDETIFSYALARGDSDNVRSSCDGLVYYAQNAKVVLKTGLWIVILDKVSAGITWVAMLLPALLVTWMMPVSIAGTGGTLTFLVSALLAWNLRAAFLEPLCLTMIMIKFHVAVRNQNIDLAWDARLREVSANFVELKRRVEASPHSATATSPATA